MKFHTYLKLCREKQALTQEQLVQKMYDFDDTFSSLEVSSFSRWERGVSIPSISKMLKTVEVLSENSSSVLPCFEDIDTNSVEDELCITGVKNLIGNSKEHILNFPSLSFTADEIEVKHLRSAADIQKALSMPHEIMQSLAGADSFFGLELLQSWALNPNNLFLLSEYKGQFYGLFFILRLKPDVFEKMINFEIDPKEFTNDDFAAFDEMGCNFPIGFFAYNEKSSQMLFLRFYAHLIANQKVISQVGTIPLLPSAKKIVQKMNLHTHKEQQRPRGMLTSYVAPLKDVLINEAVLKMIFHKQEIPVDN